MLASPGTGWGRVTRGLSSTLRSQLHTLDILHQPLPPRGLERSGPGGWLVRLKIWVCWEEVGRKGDKGGS